MSELGNAIAFSATINPILPLGFAIAWLAELLGRRSCAN